MAAERQRDALDRAIGLLEGSVGAARCTQDLARDPSYSKGFLRGLEMALDLISRPYLREED